MLRTNLGRRIPEGMRDLLPEEVALQERLERDILAFFKLWSYRSVLTPTLEYGACVQPNIEEEGIFYKFFDSKGRFLALRPELTTPIARLVCTRMRGEPLPLRLCYGADVYRDIPVRHKEFRQVGVELVGSAEELADAEVITLAVEALTLIGLENYRFNLGHMGIFSALMLEAGVDGEMRGKLEEAMARKDLVGVENLVAGSALPKKMRELCIQLPHFRGGEEILDEVLHWSERPELREAVESLRKIYRLLDAFGVQGKVSLDLGMLRGFDYYTGTIFEGYVSGVGFPVVEGGRYDALYADFGVPQPATGFAVHLGTLLEQFPPAAVAAAEILVYGRNEEALIEQCKNLRDQGKRVEMALGLMDEKEARRIAQLKKIPEVLSAAICSWTE